MEYSIIDSTETSAIAVFNPNTKYERTVNVTIIPDSVLKLFVEDYK